MKPRHFSVLLALGTLSRAWRANFSDATQCGNVTVEWSGSGGEMLGPPFVVRMAAFELAPLIIQIPTSAWNGSAQAGSYSFAMPWPAGTKFVVSMDDGFGDGTGGISGIQTVKSTSNSSCISTSITQPEHVFDVTGTFTQCSTVGVNWTEPATSETLISGLVPNGVAFRLDPPLTNARSTTWQLNIPTGTAFVLLYTDASGPGLTSPLLLSTGDGSNTRCLANGAHPSATASQTNIPETYPSATSIPGVTTSPTATQSVEQAEIGNDSTKLGPILGATFGALGLLIALGSALCLAIRRRRRKRVLPQSPALAKEMNLDAEETRLGEEQRARPGPDHPDGILVLPYVLPQDASPRQDNHRLTQGNPSSGKHATARQPSRDTINTSESSTAGASTSPSSAPPPVQRSQTSEPMVIRHEDGGALPLQRLREIIELPPGYDQLPPPPPPLPQTQRESPQRKLSLNN